MAVESVCIWQRRFVLLKTETIPNTGKRPRKCYGLEKCAHRWHPTLYGRVCVEEKVEGAYHATFIVGEERFKERDANPPTQRHTRLLL